MQNIKKYIIVKRSLHSNVKNYYSEGVWHKSIFNAEQFTIRPIAEELIKYRIKLRTIYDYCLIKEIFVPIKIEEE